MIIASVISRFQAEDLLSKKYSLWFYKRKIIKVELIYLPMYLFNLRLEDKKGQIQMDKVTVDGIKGEFAIFIEPDHKIDVLDSKNKYDFIITEDEAREIAENEYSRFLFKNNLKTPNNIKITDFSPGTKIYYPFWIVYFKRREAFDFSVIDAVNGSKQGVKMRPVFIDLLLQASDNH